MGEIEDAELKVRELDEQIASLYERKRKAARALEDAVTRAQEQDKGAGQVNTSGEATGGEAQTALPVGVESQESFGGEG